MTRRSYLLVIVALFTVFVGVHVIAWFAGPFGEQRFSAAQMSAYWEGWSAVGTVLVGVAVPGVIAFYEAKRTRQDREERRTLELARFTAFYSVTGADGGGTVRKIVWHNAASTPWINAKVLIATDPGTATEHGRDRATWNKVTGQEPGSNTIYRISLGTVPPGHSGEEIIRLPAYAGIVTFQHPLEAAEQIHWMPIGGPMSPFIPNVPADRLPLER